MATKKSEADFPSLENSATPRPAPAVKIYNPDKVRDPGLVRFGGGVLEV